MSALSPVSGRHEIERCSFKPKYQEEMRQIELERKQSENFDLAFLAFCVAGLIGAMIGFATGAIPLDPNHS